MVLKFILIFSFIIHPLFSEEYDSIENSSEITQNYSINPAKHPFGIGIQILGESGIYGVFGEYALNSLISFKAGVGTAYNFHSLYFSIQYYLTQNFVKPYLKLGIARWFQQNSIFEMKNIFPSYITQNFFLNKNVQEVNLLPLFPSLGFVIEFNNGIKFHNELNSIIDLTHLKVAIFYSSSLSFFF